MKRYGSVIKLKPEMEKEYKRLHANCWESVLKQIHDSGMRNYSIFFGGGYLFSYFEYVGEDFDGDMKKMADDPETKKWWALTDPCQEKVEWAKDGEWWSTLEEVFHCN